MKRIATFNVLGDPEPAKQLALPETLEDYQTLWAELEAAKERSVDEWRTLMRLWSAGDLYFFGMFVLSMGAVWDPYWERPRFWCKEHLEFARWVQFESDGAVLVASRFFGKSSWTTFAMNIFTKLRDPNRSSCIFSHTREAAEKHQGRIQQEITSNALLIQVWPDRFHETADGYAQLSSKAITIRRSVSRLEATFEARTFISGLPTGSHYDERFYDDVEEEQAVSSIEAMDKTEAQFTSSQDLTSPVRYAMVSGTYYHPNGLVRKLHVEKGWRLKLLAGEILPKNHDIGEPLPDVPPEERGPLGGRCYYFHPRELHDQLRIKGGINNPAARKSYTYQIVCDPIAGEPNKLDVEDLVYYDEDPLEVAKSGTLYICVDPSPGVKDSTFAWVWCLRPDRRFYWVGGFRKRLAPSERKLALFMLALEFRALGDLVQMRMEEFGQAEYISQQLEFHEARGFTDLEIAKCADNTKSKTERQWERWQPHLAARRIVFPRHLWSKDENGERVDLVAYMKERELSQFPKPYTDDGLDAASLLWEQKLGELEWPSRLRAESLNTNREAGSSDGGYMSSGAY